MLDSKNRLKKDKDFKKVFSSPKKNTVGRLSFRALKGRSSATRFGFVISNKIDKRSTRRNALKRRLRAIARNLLAKDLPNYDIIVIVRSPYVFPYDSKAITADFENGLKTLLGEQK